MATFAELKAQFAQRNPERATQLFGANTAGYIPQETVQHVTQQESFVGINEIEIQARVNKFLARMSGKRGFRFVTSTKETVWDRTTVTVFYEIDIVARQREYGLVRGF